MENSLKYQVRSREIVDLVSAMRAGRLTLTSYFQRNLVWRDAHRRDFIDTILRGYPFPQIFLARGPINLETMEAYQCVVDGQQRLNTILDYVNNKLDVDGKLFGDLTSSIKEEFLKYEVPVIDFDLNAGDPRLKDIFHRLNRTFYSLTAIEKIASAYSASEFLLAARVLSGEITKKAVEQEDYSDLDDEIEAEAEGGLEGDGGNAFGRDPGIDDVTWEWLIGRADGAYSELITSGRIFSSFEFDRKVPLMFSLNIMCTHLVGYYNRNDRVKKFLEEKNSEFPEREETIDAINGAASFIREMELPDGSIWWNKANFFTLMVELIRGSDIVALTAPIVRDKLLGFARSMPADYALAAREGVGRKSQRELRGSRLRQAILAPE